MRISDWSSDVCSSDLIPVADDQNSLKQGARGPALLEDFHFREKIFHFDHERIPERVVHARGYGVHGFFELTDSLSDVTRAELFRSEEHTSELQSLMRISYSVFCLKTKNKIIHTLLF